jgi:hypothetical protein
MTQTSTCLSVKAGMARRGQQPVPGRSLRETLQGGGVGLPAAEVDLGGALVALGGAAWTSHSLRAGAPTVLSGTTLRSLTGAPAPMMQLSPIRVPLSRIAFVPTIVLASIVQPCRMAFPCRANSDASPATEHPALGALFGHAQIEPHGIGAHSGQLCFRSMPRQPTIQYTIVRPSMASGFENLSS